MAFKRESQPFSAPKLCLLSQYFSNLSSFVLLAESNAKVSAEENAIKEVCLALQRHVNSAEVAEAAAAAMVSLCLDGELFERQ